MAKKESAEAAPSAEQKISGQVKGAVLLLALQRDVSAKVLRHLTPDLVEDITREIAKIDVVPAAMRGQVIEEFYNLALARRYMDQGGIGYARLLLEKAMRPTDAHRILKIIETQVHQQPFAFLTKTDGENLLQFIQDEHPQTIALIMSHLQANKAAEIISGLPLAKQIEVVTRVATMDNTNPEVIKEVEQGLEQRLSGLMSQTFQKVGGIEAVAEMLNLSDRSTEKAILEALEADDPDLVEQIRRLMFVFEDVILVNDKGIQSVLKEIDNEDLALALKTASPDLKDKIFRNMSERAAQMVQEDMEYMGPVRISDVEQAQQKIVDIVRRLEEAGEIIISGRGGEKEAVV